MTEQLFAIWHLPGEEWLTDHSGRVIVFMDQPDAETFRQMVDVEPPLAPEMEVRFYDGQLETIRYEQL